MKAVVTGASGFVGGYLCAHLRAAGDHVTILDARSDDPVDVTDATAVSRTIDAAHADVVYHLAARSHVGDSWTDSDRLRRVNVGGTANVVDACVTAGVARLLVVGSAEQYGTVAVDRQPVREDTPMHPITPYGESKVDAEEIARVAHREHALGVVLVRAFNHTGPGQPPTFLVPGLAARVAAAERSGDDTVAIGNLDPVRDVSDVRDVVRAYRLLAQLGQPGGAYNVCSGRGIAVSELAARLVARASRTLTLEVDPQLVRPVDVPRLVGDPAKLVAATGWVPEYDLDRTLTDVLDVARRQ